VPGREAFWIVKELLLDYVKCPSLKKIRSRSEIDNLAREIVMRLDLYYSMWGKWSEQRETLLRMALPCWIPTEDLRSFLNNMPGPQLTTTDVEQRLKVMWLRSYEDRREELQQECLTRYEQERVQGTELTAIIEMLRDYIEQEEERIAAERAEADERASEEGRIAREQKLLSGENCPWTQLQGAKHWFCRRNGWLFRLSQGDDKRWQLARVETTEEGSRSMLIGKYQLRRDATKVMRQMANMPEPKW
jgi:hypothetical protein